MHAPFKSEYGPAENVSQSGTVANEDIDIANDPEEIQIKYLFY